MAPRKSQAQSAPVASNGSSNHADADDEIVPPFFNTTFSTHRVSPLYIGPQGLTTARLEHLAHRLRDTLVGDVVRGIQVGLEAADTPMGQVGPLRAVTIRWFHAQSILGEAAVDEDSERAWDKFSGEQGRCLWIEIRDENAAYVALLLPGFSSPMDDAAAQQPAWAMQSSNADVDKSQFAHLPLLLLRMPQALKTVIGGWLSTTFDCHVGKLTLGTKTLINVWESWIRTSGLPNKGPGFVLTVSFNAPATERRSSAASDSDGGLGEGDGSAQPGLKSLEITISPSDLRRFLRAGEEDGAHERTTSDAWTNDVRERRRLAGGNADDGWGWRTSEDAPKHPFTEALARYLDHHLALNLFHPGVRVVQISCGAFVLAQSRLKIVKLGDVTSDLTRAAWMFVTQLGARIRGDLPAVV
ncbi:hypothetical protein TOPH_05661 [Tolypocladium ophioglossoides CBS 100239]|uniref:Siroheme synthase n=1 Tax=Tolypocladium ophioglossoides (strain CBS 100239) TaxID=1163406 RepID=A0A0L0N6E0_TOLOC|nr:hypothetical protein TOPH_05661 [Tolypocladium ophioglossoides CBS 100239]